MGTQNKETAIQNERQFRSRQEIIDSIIELFADNVIPITDAECILHETLEKINNQPVSLIDEDTKEIYRLRNIGKLKYYQCN